MVGIKSAENFIFDDSQNHFTFDNFLRIGILLDDQRYVSVAYAGGVQDPPADEHLSDLGQGALGDVASPDRCDDPQAHHRWCALVLDGGQAP
jgi:hypothetical protein